MSRWRILLVLALVVAPFFTLAGVGSYYLWQSGLGFKVWWGMAASMALGYLLALYWQRKRQLLRPPDFATPLVWSDKDRQAWQLVERRGQEAERLTPDQMADLQTYVATAQELALELAQFYHPGAEDPIGTLTIPELLAVVELAAHDLAELVDQYLPAGHLLTVRNWNQARQAANWYGTASNAYWAISALFSPINTGLRYLASRYGIARPWQLLQQNLLLWFYTAYVHRLGTYLIDLHSGRLRVGARRFQQLIRQQAAAATADAGDAADRIGTVTITVLGQVKAGKSSTINALLGEQQARTDVLPATAHITRYELQPPGVPTRLSLLDTGGYGHAGPRADQLAATQEAAQQADLILLVLHARSPARQADVELLKQLQAWFAARPELRMPPVLGILTHIDLLSPALEWAPPYDWQQPQRPKEIQIGEALNAVREQLDDYLVGCVPVCVAPGKVYGVHEWLLPTLLELLDDARGVALLRCLKAEADADKVRKVLRQLLAAGGQIAQVILAGRAATTRDRFAPPAR